MRNFFVNAPEIIDKFKLALMMGSSVIAVLWLNCKRWTFLLVTPIIQPNAPFLL